jgi:glycosyltransferase involved in cell wall biosynthesis
VSARLRVLVVQPYAENGGSESWLLSLLDATNELDVDVLLLKDGPMRAELERRGVPVRLRPVGTSPVDLVAPVLELARRLRRERPDVVLGNVVKAQMVAGPAGRLAGVPTVWAKHDHGFDGPVTVLLGQLSTRVVAAVEELGTAVRRRDVVVVPPPRPDPPPAERAEALQALRALGVRLDDGVPTAVIAGRLVPFKGVDDAVRALALPGAAGWRLVVAGADDHAAPGETDRLRAVARDVRVDDRVELVGHVPGLARWLAAFDALLVLTRPGGRRNPGREGFGTSAFEAMLAGVPVVAVEGGAVVRRLAGRAGVGVPPADPVAVAAALGRLADPAVRAEMGRAGRAITAEAPDAAACAGLLVEVLRDAASAQRRRRR